MITDTSDPIRRVSSLTNLTESIDKIDNSHKRWELEIIDSHDDAKVVAIANDELKDRNLREYSDHVGRLEYDSTGIMTFHFHENALDGRVWINPIGHRAIGVGNTQCSDPRTLGPIVKDVIDGIEAYSDIIGYDISKISAGSIANGGHLTSYEITYDLILGTHR